MKALVTGVKGQLGHDVMNELAKRGYEGVGVDVEEMDITDAACILPCHTGPAPHLCISSIGTVDMRRSCHTYYGSDNH